MIALGICLGFLWCASLLLMALWAATAPAAYEDEKGFHYGKEPAATAIDPAETGRYA